MVILFQIKSKDCAKTKHRASSIIIIPSTEQWTGRSMQSIHKAYCQKCIDTKSDIHKALVQLRSTLLGQGLPSPAVVLFNCPVRGIMPIVNRLLINSNDGELCVVLVKRQRMIRAMILSEIMLLFC